MDSASQTVAPQSEDYWSSKPAAPAAPPPNDESYWSYKSPVVAARAQQAPAAPARQLPNATIGAAPAPTWSQRARDWIANSDPGETLQTYAPKVSSALGLTPTETDSGRIERVENESFPYHPIQAAKDIDQGMRVASDQAYTDAYNKLAGEHPDWDEGALQRVLASRGVRQQTGSELAGGANKVIGGLLEESKPIIGEQLIADPVRAALAWGAASTLQTGAQAGAKALGATPSEQELAGNVAGAGGAALGWEALPHPTATPAPDLNLGVYTPKEPLMLGAGEAGPLPPVEFPDDTPTFPLPQHPAAQLPATTAGEAPPNPQASPPPFNPATAVERTTPPTQFAPRPEPIPARGMVADANGNIVVQRPGLPPPGETAGKIKPIIPKMVPPPAPVAPAPPQPTSSAVMVSPPSNIQPAPESPQAAPQTPPATIPPSVAPNAPAAPEAGQRPAVQASGEPAELRQSAQEQKPVLEQAAQQVAAAVPGAEVVGPRVKSTDSMENKDDRGKPPETNIDNLGVRVVAPNPDAVPAVQQAIESQLPVASKDKIDNNGLDIPQYGVQTGKPGEPNQVSEVQVIPGPAVAKAMKETDDLYAQQKEAQADLDAAKPGSWKHKAAQKEVDDLGEKIKAAMDKAKAQDAKQPENQGRATLSESKDQTQFGNPAPAKPLTKGTPVTLKDGTAGTIKGGNPNEPNGGRWMVNTPKGSVLANGKDITPTDATANAPQTPLGAPLTTRVDQIKEAVAKGIPVKIFTARAGDPQVTAWVQQNGLGDITVTNVKGHDFGALLDNEVNVSTNQDKPFEMPEVPAGKALYVDLDGTLAKEPGTEGTPARTITTPKLSASAPSQAKLVSVDSLPKEVQSDLANILATNQPFLKDSKFDEEDIRNNLFGLTDSPNVKLGKTSVEQLYKTMDRGNSTVAVRNYVEKLKEPSFEFEPILISGGKFLDGGHRLEAYHSAGRELIPTVDVTNLMEASPEKWEAWMNGTGTAEDTFGGTKEPANEQRVSAEQPAGAVANIPKEEKTNASEVGKPAEMAVHPERKESPGGGGREGVAGQQQGTQTAGESAVQAKPGGEADRKEEGLNAKKSRALGDTLNAENAYGQTMRSIFGDEDWKGMSEAERRDAIESDYDEAEKEENQERQKKEADEEFDQEVDRKIAYMDGKQSAVESILKSRGIQFNAKGSSTYSRYLSFDLPNDEAGTIRISDHAPPVGRGGMIEGGLDYHDEADVSLHPGSDSLGKVEKFLDRKIVAAPAKPSFSATARERAGVKPVEKTVEAVEKKPQFSAAARAKAQPKKAEEVPAAQTAIEQHRAAHIPGKFAQMVLDHGKAADKLVALMKDPKADPKELAAAAAKVDELAPEMSKETGDAGGPVYAEDFGYKPKAEKTAAEAKQKKSDLGSTLGGLISGEEGSFTPAVVRDALANATEPLRDALERYAAEASRAEDIQKGLIHTERAQRARQVRVVQTIERLLKKEGFTPEDGKQVFRHIEDPAVKLTPKQAELRDKWIKPLNEAARKQYTISKLIQSGKFPIEDILAGKVSKEDIAKYAPMVDGYMHRIAAGHNTQLDRIMAGVSKGFGGKRGTLSKALSSAKHAVFQEAHSPTGQREVVAIKGGRVRQFINAANVDVIDNRIAGLQEGLAQAKAELKPDQELIDRQQQQIWDLKAKRALVEQEGLTTIDLGAHKSRYVTTEQLADEAVKPLERKLSKIETEERTLRATQSRMAASVGRLRNIAVQKADLERQIAAVRASVGPDQAAESGMNQDEILAERLRPVQAQVDRLTKEQAKLNATPGRTSAQDRRLGRIAKQLKELDAHKGDIEDQHVSEGLQGRYWRDKFGGLWQFHRGTTEFITGRTGQQYYDNAILSSTVNYLDTARAAQAAAVIESQKATLEENGLLTRETDPSKIPDGWKGTQLMQMRGLSFPPHIADAYDQFAEKMGRGSPDLLDKINRFNVQMVLMNPLMHGKNVISNWITGKLSEGIASGRILNPVRYVANAKAGIRSLNAVWSLNEDYLHPLEHGLDLLRTNPNFDAGQEELVRSLAAHLAIDKETAALWKKALGIPGNILGALRHINHTATFGMNDLFTLQAYYSALDRFTRDGIPDPETAARDWAHRQVVEYRPPVRFMGSRAAEKVLENPKLSAFWAYHSDLLRQVATAVGDAAGVGFKEQEGTPGKNEFGQGPAAVRANGLAKLAVMAAIAAALYPLILDPLAKKLTGDDRAKAPRGGLPGLASNVYESAKGERDWSSTASGVFTPSLGTENLMEMVANRDFFTGRHIRGADQEWKGQVQQLASWLGKRSLAGQLAGRIDQGEGKQAMFALMGFTFPMEHGLKEAAEIRRDKAGSNPPDPEKSKVFQSILAAAEQARRSDGNDTRLADALEDSGKLSKGQERELEEAILWPPIVFATNGMNPEEVYRVFEKSTEDEKRDLLNPESSTAGIGKSYPNTARKALGKYLKELSDADKDSEAAKVEAEFDQYGGVD